MVFVAKIFTPGTKPTLRGTSMVPITGRNLEIECTVRIIRVYTASVLDAFLSALDDL